jgi:hypothetical protein
MAGSDGDRRRDGPGWEMPSTMPPRTDCQTDAITDRTTRKKTISDMNSPRKRHMAETPQ